MTTPYKMPHAYVGQIVHYFHQAGATACIGLVYAVGTEVLSLGVFEPSGFEFLDGVRHIADPNKQAIACSGFGVWDYTPDPAAAAVRQLGSLEARLAALDAKVADLLLVTAPKTK